MAELITTPVGVNYDPNNAQYPFWNQNGETNPNALIAVTCDKSVVGEITSYLWRMQRADLSISTIITQEFSTKDGVTFTPSVSENGLLTWTNNGGLPNPPAVNVMGPAGQDGGRGPQGIQGIQGEAGVSPTVYISDYDGGTQVTIIDANGTQVFNVPDGQPGETGPAPEISLAALITQDDTGIPSAAVQKSGSGTSQEFTITFKNIQGQQGEQGVPGQAPTLTIATIQGGHAITFTTPDGSQTFNVMDGQDGFSPSISIEDIEGGHAVTFTDSTGSQTINIMDGSDGGKGPAGEAGKDAPVPTPQANITQEGDLGVSVDVTEGADGKPIWTFAFTGITAGSGGGGEGTVPVINMEVEVEDTVGTPSGTITRTGTDDNVLFHLKLSGIKGQRGENGTDGTNGTNGTNGTDGSSVTVEATETTTGATLVFTDKNGSQTVNLKNGEDGYSPSVVTTPVQGGTEVTIMDKDGSESFIVTDGQDGGPGPKGETGAIPELTITATQGDNEVPVEKTGEGAAQAFNFAFPGGSGGGSANIIKLQQLPVGTEVTIPAGSYILCHNENVITMPEPAGLYLSNENVRFNYGGALFGGNSTKFLLGASSSTGYVLLDTEKWIKIYSDITYTVKSSTWLEAEIGISYNYKMYAELAITP